MIQLYTMKYANNNHNTIKVIIVFKKYIYLFFYTALIDMPTIHIDTRMATALTRQPMPVLRGGRWRTTISRKINAQPGDLDAILDKG